MPEYAMRHPVWQCLAARLDHMTKDRASGSFTVHQAWARLSAMDAGAHDVIFRGRRWGLTLAKADDLRRMTLFAEARDGSDHVSANFYHTAFTGIMLKPCEMPTQQVLSFIAGFSLAR
jgi:hypothetical protein